MDSWQYLWYQAPVSFCEASFISNQKVAGYAENIHATIAHLCISCHASPYYNSLDSQLGKTDDLVVEDTRTEADSLCGD